MHNISVTETTCSLQILDLIKFSLFISKVLIQQFGEKYFLVELLAVIKDSISDEFILDNFYLNHQLASELDLYCRLLNFRQNCDNIRWRALAERLDNDVIVLLQVLDRMIKELINALGSLKKPSDSPCNKP